MFKIAPLVGVICIKLIKTSVTFSVVEFFTRILSETPRIILALNIQLGSRPWKMAFISTEPTVFIGQPVKLY